MSLVSFTKISGCFVFCFFFLNRSRFTATITALVQKESLNYDLRVGGLAGRGAELSLFPTGSLAVVPNYPGS